jgi:hypothetical protein
MPACWQNLEIGHEPHKIVSLTWKLETYVHQSEIAINDSFDSLRPSLSGTIWLNPAVCALIYQLSSRSPRDF